MLVDDHYLVRVGLANVLGFEPDLEGFAPGAAGGAASSLAKRVGQPELLKAIRLVAEGRTYVPAEIAVRLAERLPCEELTSREQQGLALGVEGGTEPQSARQPG